MFGLTNIIFVFHQSNFTINWVLDLTKYFDVSVYLFFIFELTENLIIIMFYISIPFGFTM